MKSTLKAIALSLIPILLISLSILAQSGCSLTKQITTEAIPEVQPEPTEPVFAYEGPVNPNEFGDWEVTISFPAYAYGYMWYIIQNPDPNSEIEFVEILVNVLWGNMPGYRFWIGDEPYTYFAEEERYVNSPLTEQEKQNCRSCHQDKIKPNPINRSI